MNSQSVLFIDKKVLKFEKYYKKNASIYIKWVSLFFQKMTFNSKIILYLYKCVKEKISARPINSLENMKGK